MASPSGVPTEQLPLLQAEGLKSKLAAAEQQVAELQRKEVEARSEINMLTSSMGSQQQQHHELRGSHMRRHIPCIRTEMLKEAGHNFQPQTCLYLPAV